MATINKLFRNRMLWLLVVGFLVLLVVAWLISSAGTRMLGGVESWNTWLGDNYWSLLVWRGVIYAFLVKGWLWMKARAIARNDSLECKSRLRRCEIMSIITVMAFELRNVL